MAHQVPGIVPGRLRDAAGRHRFSTSRARAQAGLIRPTSIISDTIYGETLPEIYHDDEGVPQLGLPVRCKVAAGRDESDFYIALGLIGKGPLGALTTPQMWDQNGDGTPDTFIGSTLDGAAEPWLPGRFDGKAQGGRERDIRAALRVGLGSRRRARVFQPRPRGAVAGRALPAAGSPIQRTAAR
jgi:hypothetical protein